MIGKGLFAACITAMLGSTTVGLCAPGDTQRLNYADKRVVVEFEPNVVTPPIGAAEGAIGSFRFSSPGLLSLLSSVGATRLARVFPGFTHESIHTTSVTGEPITLPYDLTDVYTISLSDTNVIGTVIALRSAHSSVRIVEPDYIGWMDYSPNDSLFTQQWWLKNTGQFGGTSGEDVRAASAWDVATGIGAPIRVGIIDTGIDLGHPDLGVIEQGPNYINPGAPPDDADPVSHGTACAGIVGARGNNREGVAGVNWGTQLVAIKVSSAGSILQTDAATALDWARTNGLRIVNMSFGWTVIPDVFRQAMKNNNSAGLLQVVSMGNQGDNTAQYPADLPYFSESVGGVTNAGNRWMNVDIGCGSTGGSTWGNWIDISAPAKGITTTRSRTTGSYYTTTDQCGGFGGTSASTPMVTGAAALVASRQPTLDGEDLSQVLNRTARDRTQYGVGWDNQTGWGVVNTDSALKYVGGQQRILRGTASTVYTYGSPTGVQLDIIDAPCVASTNYGSLRYEIRTNVTFSPPFYAPPVVWGRFVGSVGWNSDNPHSDPSEPVGWAGVVAGSVTTSGCVLYTYVYDVKGSLGQHLAWCPTTQTNARMSWTAIGPSGPDPDVVQSFFVPQTGTVAAPTEGAAAIQSFHACPNNDGGSSLPNNARIKVVVRDASGNGISGIAAADICLLLNGGTPQLPPAGQGFSGIGADSIVANGLYNSSPLCPDVRRIAADGPTDASGVTYITFTGSTPGNPGVGVRDPSRKWGHYDAEIPVYVFWKKLQGRLTSSSGNGSYFLQVKNFDFEGGLDATQNMGEWVSSSDYNSVVGRNQQSDSADPKNWWCDFNNDGIINSLDIAPVQAHLSHNCSTPNNP